MLLNIDRLKGYVRGVLHVGAYVGEEFKLYKELGIQNCIFFEPQSYIFELLQRNIGHSGQCYNIALGDFNGVADINISSTIGGIPMGSGASSSLLKPKLHLTQHPNIKFHSKEKIMVRKLDAFMREQSIDVIQFNMMNIDVQGYELNVLKGAVETLPYIDFIVTEVNRAELYEDCVQIEELDLFLLEFGFVRRETSWAGDTWGDALYSKVDI
jgi:FkbM family methyltransferase